MKTALITGATKGIGLAIAQAFAAEGISLALCARTENDLISVKTALLQINPAISIFTKTVDCGNQQQVLAFAKEAEKALQHINIIVNNVGIFYPGSMLDEDENALQKQLDVNLLCGYTLYRFFAKKLMEAKSGHIFNICSSASKNAVVTAGSYSVTKFAQRGLNNVMRQELKAHQVKVTAIFPGSTLTESWEGTAVPPEKFISPQDVASAVINCLRMSAGANAAELFIQTTTQEI